MRQSAGVRELRIVRGKSVVAQFGPGLPEEQAQDELDRGVLESGKAAFQRIEMPGQPPALRVVVPFIAQENFRGTNCLSCHAAKAGSVNGAASVVIDLGKDEAELDALKKNLWLGHLAIQIFLSLLIVLIVRKTMVRNIATPIKKLQMAMSEIQRNNDLSRRADVDENNPDIGEMASTFNSCWTAWNRPTSAWSCSPRCSRIAAKRSSLPMPTGTSSWPIRRSSRSPNIPGRGRRQEPEIA